jgi:hypothetical protein
MDISTIYMLRPDVVASVLEDGAVLLDLESKFFYSVNQSAWAVLQMFEIGAKPESVISTSLGWRGDNESDGKVEEFIHYLEQEGLIKPADNPSEVVSDIKLHGDWSDPTIEKQKEPLQRIMTSAFDPTMPLAE